MRDVFCAALAGLVLAVLVINFWLIPLGAT